MSKFDYTRALLAGVHGSGRGVLVHRALLLILGSDAAIIMSQILYWSETKNGGWFYKSDADWHQELGMSRHVIRRCVHGSKDAPNKIALINFGVDVDVRKANNVPTTYYRVNKAKLERNLASYHDLFIKHGFIQTADAMQESTQSTVENPDNACRESTQSTVENPDNPLTKSTTENTTHVATDEPPQGVSKKTPQQLMVGALLEAFNIPEDVATKTDIGIAVRTGGMLRKAGVSIEEVPDLVSFVNRLSQGRWEVNMSNITAHGRVAKYLQAKARQAEAGAVTIVTDETPEDVLDEMQRQIEIGRLRVEGDQKRHRGEDQTIDISALYRNDGNE